MEIRSGGIPNGHDAGSNSDRPPASGAEWSDNWIGDADAVEAEIQALFLAGIDAHSAPMRDDGAAELLRQRREALIARLADPELRARLAALFEAHDALPPELPRVRVEPPDPQRLIGYRFGEFTVQSLLASGSTADVYVAQQRSPQREVVLKVRRAQHGTDGQVRRFLAEAERLAGFTHAGVAHIYGSGVESVAVSRITQQDDPVGDAHSHTPIAWIAMERVAGMTLAQWRDRGSHSASERCRVVARAAEIVAAAHAVGLVHRDLAPRNIAVATDGTPRILDYGIAHTLHALTEHPAIEGTRGFASPEQERGLPASTGDDVHALGRLLQWIAPDAPDAALALARAATGLSTGRPTAAQFAERLAIASASPKRRHAAMWMLAAATCVGGAVMIVSPASQRRAHLATPVSRASADAIDRILAAMLATASPARGGTSKTTVLEAAAQAKEQILAETVAPPRTRYRALEQIMDLQNEYGNYAGAADTAQSAAAIVDTDPDAAPLHAVRLRARSAVLRAHCDDRAAAQAALESSVAELALAASLITDAAVMPMDSAEQQLHRNYAQAHVYLALAAKLNKDLVQARELSEIAMPFHRTGVFAGARSAVTYLINRAKLEQSLGNLDAAVMLANEAVEVSKLAEADDELEQLSTRALQATVLEAAGQLPEAAAVYRESLEAWIRIGGDTHPKVITALNNLGLNLSRQGKHADAIPLIEDACRRAIARHGERNQHTIDSHGNLALAYSSAGRAEDAAAVIERYLPVIREAQGSPSIDECVWLHFLAELRAEQGRLADARKLLEQVISTCQDLPELKGTVKDARTLLQKLTEGATP